MRQVRVLSASCLSALPPSAPPAEQLAANVRLVVTALQAARAYRPDVVCFPELVLHYYPGAPMRETVRLALAPDDPPVLAIAAAVRALGSQVLVGMLERVGDRVTNSALLFAADGTLRGTYRKYQPTSYEMADGVWPGDAVPVWDTPAGRLGVAICFDLKFPEVGLALARGGAQLVLWPTMFFGGRRLVAWATDYGCHLLRCHAVGSALVDPGGQLVAEEGQPLPLADEAGTVRWLSATINTDHRTYHYDFHREKLAALELRYGPEVSLRHNRHEGTFVLASESPARTVDDLEREFALTPLRAYLDAATADRRQRLQGTV
jgi:predicted amidohydrolase